MNSQLIDDLAKLEESLGKIELAKAELPKYEMIKSALEKENFAEVWALSVSIASFFEKAGNTDDNVTYDFFTRIKEFAKGVITLENTSGIEKKAKEEIEAEQREYENRVKEYIGDQTSPFCSAAKIEVELLNKDFEEKKAALGPDPAKNGNLWGVIAAVLAGGLIADFIHPVIGVIVMAIIFVVVRNARRKMTAPAHNEWQAKMDSLTAKNTTDVNAVNAKRDAACKDLLGRRDALLASGSYGQSWPDDEVTSTLLEFETEHNKEMTRIQEERDSAIEHSTQLANDLRTTWEDGLKERDLSFVNTGIEALTLMKNNNEAIIEEISPELGSRYLTPEIIGKLLEYARGGRADSYKEAANVYEQELQHEAAMEQQRQLEEQRMREMAYQAQLNRQQQLEAQQQMQAHQQTLIAEQRRANEIQAAHNQAMLAANQAAAQASEQLSQKRAQEMCQHCRYYYIEGYGKKMTYHCSQGLSVGENPNCPVFSKKIQ